jgi:(1->4)-alpha-D-glucan 1-alpha-D-glucosylmutase
MNETPLLDELSRWAGIVPGYYDIHGTYHRAGESEKRMILSAMRISVKDESDAKGELDRIADEEASRFLEPVSIIGEEDHSVAVHLPNALSNEAWSGEIVLEDGSRIVLTPVPEQIEERGRDRFSGRLTIPEIPYGYHRLRIQGGERTEESMLIRTPERCYLPPSLTGWTGLSLQLYAIRSGSGSGIGDFGDLRRMIDFAADCGLRAIGINPIHALYPANPAHRSPYAPSGRIGLHYAVLDLRAIPGFDENDLQEKRGRASRPSHVNVPQHAMQTLQSEQIIDYVSILTEKFSVLERIFLRFRSVGDQTAFYHFLEQSDGIIHQAQFDLLYEHFFQSHGYCSFREWPSEFADPEGESVKRFIDAHHERYLFYAFLQWNLRLQLDDLSLYASSKGIALYLDLAVGADAGGAEVWSRGGDYAIGISIGAPPDPFAPDGQNWGLAPYDPHALRADLYRPFIEMIRSNMTEGGMIRLDHVMGLFRLYWTADGTGAYVRYPEKELLGILALESMRKRCTVIGEDLGTVLPEIRTELKNRNILSWKILYFEMDGEHFKNPGDYEKLSVATLNTHDLPTFAGFLNGSDLRIRAGITGSTGKSLRKSLRERNAAVLGIKELLLRHGYPETSDVEALNRQIHLLLAGSSSAIFLVSMHDLLMETDQPNLPGTVHEYPNWSLRYTKSLEEIMGDEKIRDFLVDMISERMRFRSMKQ